MVCGIRANLQDREVIDISMSEVSTGFDDVSHSRVIPLANNTGHMMAISEGGLEERLNGMGKPW